MAPSSVTQGNQIGASALQRSTWSSALQQAQGSTGQVGTSGLAGNDNSATVTVSTTAALPTTTQTQTETTPLTQTSFHVPSWAWYAGAAIIAIAVLTFVISMFKDHSNSI